MTTLARRAFHPDQLDPVGRHLLPVLRYFLCALQGDKDNRWRIGYTAAAEVWGESRGLVIAHRAQNFIAALVHSRKERLLHTDPLSFDGCMDLTNDECLLMALLTHIRADEAPQARDILAILTQGHVEAEVVRSALSLCAVLDGMSGYGASCRKPTLSVV